MSWPQVRRCASWVLVGGSLGLALLSTWIVSGNAPGGWRMVGVEIQAAGRDAGTQWMVVVCLMSYLVTFLFLERRIAPQENVENTETETGGRRARPEPPETGSRSFPFAILAFFRGKIANTDFWLVGFVGLVLLRYAFAYETASRSLSPLVLLAGIVFGKGVALWGAWEPRLKVKGSGLNLGEGSNAESPPINFQPSTLNKARAILTVLVLLLACASQWQPDHGMEFQYRGQRRWTGAWDNPNLYGLLMGVGTVLAVGLFVQSLKSKGQRPGSANERHLTQRPHPQPLSHLLGEGGVELSPNGAEREGEGSTANAQRLTSKVRRILSRASRHTSLLLLLLAVGLCAHGLIKSYSRGAWVGTACGLGWLLWKWNSRTHLTQNPHPQPLSQRLGEGGVGLSPRPPGGARKPLPRLASRLTRHASRTFWLSASVLLASVLVLAFWQFRHTENPLARRVFSVGNPNDFSWRNRVSAWQGAGRMMLDRPLAGFGWSQAETVFREQYKPVRLEDTAAIQMNDYLMLGISAGTPALLGLLIYLWHVSRGVGREQTEGCSSPVTFHPSLPTICFAGAIVGMIGFWFDGGLFKLPTAVVFWVLMELARISPLPASGHPLPVRRGEGQGEGHVSSPRQLQIVLRWVAGIVAGLALLQTTFHLGLPQLAVSERTRSLARNYLIPAREMADFDSLAAQSNWFGQPLKHLIQQAHLANYNRELVNWKLDDALYRQFVLSSEIDPAWDGGMNWRRPLWEHFYPRIRKEHSLETAAEIILRQLHERVIIQTGGDSPDSIAAGWEQQRTSERGFAAISIAALRSAGIPARPSADGQPEFWNGAKWKAAPRPR